jgi:uncharacterized membrane protein SirB2
MYSTVKLIHISAAILTISGFALRGFWMLSESVWLDHKLVKVLPHVLDTAFLLSGITLIWILGLSVQDQPWLLAKLALLVVYILFGMVALRRGRSPGVRKTAFALAIATFIYIAGIACNKSVLSWFEAAVA